MVLYTTARILAWSYIALIEETFLTEILFVTWKGLIIMLEFYQIHSVNTNQMRYNIHIRQHVCCIMHMRKSSSMCNLYDMSVCLVCHDRRYGRDHHKHVCRDHHTDCGLVALCFFSGNTSTKDAVSLFLMGSNLALYDTTHPRVTFVFCATCEICTKILSNPDRSGLINPYPLSANHSTTCPRWHVATLFFGISSSAFLYNTVRWY